MKRLVFRIFCAVSLLLFLATLSLWIRSHWRLDRLDLARTTRFTVVSDRGVVAISRQWFTDGPWPGPRHFHALEPEPITLYTIPIERELVRRPSWSYSTWPGDHLGTSDGRVLSSQGFTLTFPHYLPAFLTFLLPALQTLRLFRRRHRLRNNVCPTCSYDLRASKHKCPECGTPIPTATGSTFSVRG